MSFLSLATPPSIKKKKWQLMVRLPKPKIRLLVGNPPLLSNNSYKNVSSHHHSWRSLKNLVTWRTQIEQRPNLIMKKRSSLLNSLSLLMV